MINKRAKPDINAENIERVLRLVAWIIAEFGEVEYVPLMERLEAELTIFKQARDPPERGPSWTTRAFAARI